MKNMLILGTCLILSGSYKSEAANGKNKLEHRKVFFDDVRAGNQISPKPKPIKKPATTGTAVKTSGKAVVILISVVPNIMQYDKNTFTVKAGQKVTIEFENPDGMQHNFVLIKAGALDKVGLAADDMARDPKGAEKSYVPEMPEVLYATKLLNPQESTTLQITAPATPGDYPYICTFPGHWRIMKGVMKVVK